MSSVVVEVVVVAVSLLASAVTLSAKLVRKDLVRLFVGKVVAPDRNVELVEQKRAEDVEEVTRASSPLGLRTALTVACGLLVGIVAGFLTILNGAGAPQAVLAGAAAAVAAGGGILALLDGNRR